MICVSWAFAKQVAVVDNVETARDEPHHGNVNPGDVEKRGEGLKEDGDG